MRPARPPEDLHSRLAAALRENKRLRAETERMVEASRTWTSAVARNIHDAPRWGSPPAPGGADAHARWPRG